jgi:hypothetical protein
VALTGGDIKSPLIGVTEGAVGRTVDTDRHRVGLQDSAGGSPHVDHGTGTAGPIAGGAYDVARVPRVAEPDAAQTVDGQVVGRVEPLPVQTVDNGRGTAVGLEAHHRTPAGAATIKAACGVEGQAVGVVGIFPLWFDSVVSVPYVFGGILLALGSAT